MNNREGASPSLLFLWILYIGRNAKAMNKVYNFKKQKGNWTIKTKIDLRPKTILKTIIIAVAIIAIIWSVIKWLS